MKLCIENSHMKIVGFCNRRIRNVYIFLKNKVFTQISRIFPIQISSKFCLINICFMVPIKVLLFLNLYHFIICMCSHATRHLVGSLTEFIAKTTLIIWSPTIAKRCNTLHTPPHKLPFPLSYSPLFASRFSL